MVLYHSERKETKTYTNIGINIYVIYNCEYMHATRRSATETHGD